MKFLTPIIDHFFSALTPTHRNHIFRINTTASSADYIKSSKVDLFLSNYSVQVKNELFWYNAEDNRFFKVSAIATTPV